MLGGKFKGKVNTNALSIKNVCATPERIYRSGVVHSSILKALEIQIFSFSLFVF
jgi:hypothetical protein